MYMVRAVFVWVCLELSQMDKQILQKILFIFFHLLCDYFFLNIKQRTIQKSCFHHVLPCIRCKR